MTSDEQDITTHDGEPEVLSLSGAGEAKKQNIPWRMILLWLSLGSSIVGALVSTKMLTRFEKQVVEAREAAKPANVSIVKMTAPDCTDCFDIDGALEAFRKQNVNVVEERTVVFDSSEGQELVKNLGIARVPTYIVTGEITKKSLDGFLKANGEIRGDQFIFTNITPIFVDPNTKREVGRVIATYLTDATCPQCVNPKHTVEAYKQAGVKIVEEREFAWTTPDARTLIARYGIGKLPTVLLSSDIDAYDNVKSSWSKIGTVESDGTYVARELPLPYRDLAQGKIVGLVDLIYLVDASCAECYKPELTQRAVLVRNFGIGFRSEKTVDIATAAGQGLVSKYKITAVPTILLSPDADQYQNLKAAWPEVGTIESDGWYVFREVNHFGGPIYKDLSTQQVVRPAAQSADTPQGQ